MASTTSRDQISISGSSVPTAMKFPKLVAEEFVSAGVVEVEDVGGKSSHSRQRGKVGSIRSW